MAEYPPGNSYQEKNRNKGEKPKNEVTPKVEKIVEGKVVIRKKPLSRKIKETFFGGDSRSIGGYLVFDVFVPAAQDLVVDIVTEGIERVMFPDGRIGGGRRRRSGGSRFGSAKTDYQGSFRGSQPKSMFNTTRVDPREEERRRPTRRGGRSSFDLDEIVVPSRAEADQILMKMYDLIERFGRVSVNDLYEMIGKTGPFTGDAYGWEDPADITSARARRERNGDYWLDLPAPEELSR